MCSHPNFTFAALAALVAEIAKAQEDSNTWNNYPQKSSQDISKSASSMEKIRRSLLTADQVTTSSSGLINQVRCSCSGGLNFFLIFLSV